MCAGGRERLQLVGCGSGSCVDVALLSARFCAVHLQVVFGCRDGFHEGSAFFGLYRQSSRLASLSSTISCVWHDRDDRASVCAALAAPLETVGVCSDQHVRSFSGVSCQATRYPPLVERVERVCISGLGRWVSSALQYASLASAASISCLRTRSWIRCAVLLALPARTTFLFFHRLFAVIAWTSLHGSSR